MSKIEVTLPDVGEGLHEAEIVRWLIQPGQTVARDQPLVEIQTDKSIVDLPAPGDGVVAAVHGAVGDMVAVGTVLVTLDATSSDKPRRAAGAGATTETGAARTAMTQAPEAPSQGAPLHSARVRASPATRRAAMRAGIDIGTIEGSGPGGRVTTADVERHATAPTVAGAASSASSDPDQGIGTPAGSDTGPMDQAVPLQGIRKRIAQAMSESWHRIPHITDMREVPAGGLVSARSTLERATGRHVTYLPLLMMIVAEALRRNPWLNATLDDAGQAVTRHSAVNLGVATATSEGIVVPVVQDVRGRPLFDLVDETARLVSKARTGRLARDDSMGGTFTISNGGSFGGWVGTPIVRSPEVAVALFGRLQDRVVAVDGAPIVQAVLPVSVSADHRVVDGEHLGRFIGDVSMLAGDPILLLAEGAQWS